MSEVNLNNQLISKFGLTDQEVLFREEKDSSIDLDFFVCTNCYAVFMKHFNNCRVCDSGSLVKKVTLRASRQFGFTLLVNNCERDET